MTEYYNRQDRIRDLKVMIEADREHMMRALEEDRYLTAQRHLQAIIDNTAELNQLIES